MDFLDFPELAEHKLYLRGYIACLHRPLQHAIRPVAVQHSGRDVVLGVGHIHIPRQRMHLDAVGFLYLRFRAVGDEVRGQHFARAYIYYSVRHHVLVVDVVPRRGAGVERVADYIQCRDGYIQRVNDLVGLGVDAIELRRRAVVVATRTDP